MVNDWITAPTTRGAELVLTGVVRQEDPVRDTIRALSDPRNYAWVLDVRTRQEEL